MDILGLGRPPDTRPIEGSEYIRKLHKYLTANISKLAPTPQRKAEPTFFQQSYTLLTLGLDPNSKPLSRNVKVPLTLGFGGASDAKVAPTKPVLLRLPPDRLLYLLLRWQSLPQALPHVGRTDVPISPGVPVASRGARVDERERKGQGDVDSVKSWVGSMRSVSLGTVGSQATTIPGFGWMGRKEEVTEDQVLLALYSAFSVLPALLIHPPFLSDKPIAELVEAGGYTQLGGIDVRIPLDVLRNLQTLELEAYDPRGLLIPPNPGLRSLTVRDVQDADDWIEELLAVEVDGSDTPTARFPNLRHLSLYSTTMISFPSLPLDRLTHLDLSHNLLNSIPASLSSLHSLQSLNLSHNMIVSVRNAPQVLGNITTLNLSKNRIDCLVGLERLLGLERVDVRSNELYEVGEVGRLSVLPHIKEVWCVNNIFDQAASGDWRTDLGIAFASEGRNVIVDDRPWTWQEKRNIDAALATKGRQSHSRVPSSTTAARIPAPPPRQVQSKPPAPAALHQAEPEITNSDAGPSKTPKTHMSPATTNSPASTSSAAVQKKRRPRRVITLDDDVQEEPIQEDRIGGSMRLPKTERKGDGERKVGTTNTSFTVPKKTQIRLGIGADTFQPPGTGR